MNKSSIMLLFSFAIVYAQQFSIDDALLTEFSSGARAAAMGRAFTALSDDATALAWNPAGLVSLKKSAVSFSGMIRFGSIHLEPRANILNTTDYYGKFGGSAVFNYFGFAVPFRTGDYDIVASVAVRNCVDLHESLSLTSHNTLSQSEETLSTNRNGGLYTLSLGTGIQIFKDFSVGACLNFLTGRQTKKITEQAATRSAAVMNWDSWENQFAGVSFDAGVIWRISRVLTVGTRATFPHNIHYSNIEYKNSDDEELEMDLEASLFKPTLLANGLALHYTKDFVFTFDYILRPWKKVNIFLDGIGNDRVFTTANSFHMGFEYLFHTRSFAVPIRCGFFNMSEQFFEYNSESLDYKGDQVISHFLTTGFGIHSNRINFNVSAEFKMMQYQSPFYNQTATPIEYRLSRINIICGFDFLI